MSQRIALIGNMNNNFFSLCRHLRDAGFDAHLFLLTEFDHFLPGCDAIGDNYKEYVHQTTWDQYYFFDPALKDKIKQDIGHYKYIIGCDWVPAYLQLIGRKLDVFVPYGGDIRSFTKPSGNLSAMLRFYRFATLKRPVDPGRYRAHLQVKGIQQSRLIICDHAPHLEPYFNKFFRQTPREKVSIPMVYDILKGVTNAQMQEHYNTPFLREVDEKIGKFNKIFISHMRHYWVTDDFPKGNDILIKAFSAFCKKRQDVCLILFEYGPDVQASRKLVDDLGLNGNIVWLPTMDRKYILSILNKTDLCVGEVASSFLTYGVALEAIITKTPFAHNFNEAAIDAEYDYLYNCFHTSNEQELLEVMETVYNGNFDKEKMVNDSYKWYQELIVNKFIDSITSVTT